MLDVQYFGEPVDLDQPVYQAEAERPGKPIRVRMQPSLLRGSGSHVAWKGVAWTVGCPTPADAILLRQALEALFAAVSVVGPARVIQMLTGAPESA